MRAGAWNDDVPASDECAQERLIHWSLWSGRWESNPRPQRSNLLNILASLPLPLQKLPPRQYRIFRLHPNSNFAPERPSVTTRNINHFQAAPL